MYRARHILRKFLAIVVLPLAALGGQMPSGCICADGHFEPVCDNCHSSANSSQPANHDAQRRGSRSCCSQKHASPLATANGHGHTAKFLPSTCCSRLEKAPVVVTNRFIAERELKLAAIDNSISPIRFPAVFERQTQIQATDVRPPRERLILLQHFLI